MKSLQLFADEVAPLLCAEHNWKDWDPIFLHGAGGLIWDPFLDELSTHFRVVAPFLPGTGGSKGDERLRDFMDLLLIYHDFFDALHWDAVNIIGHSMGGMIACELAAIDPSRVEHLVAICPTGVFHDDEPMDDIFAMMPDELAKRIAINPYAPAVLALTSLPDAIDQKIEVIIERVETLAAASKFLWPLPDQGLRRRMHRIKAPSLIVWGRQDGLIPVYYAKDCAKGIPNATLAIIEQASHLVHLEKVQEVLPLILHFLRQPVAKAS